MKISLPQEVKDIIRKFRDKEYEIYIVGGAVRDLMMGKSVVDWDFTTNATPEEIQSLFEDSFYENVFGTVGIAAKEEGLKPHEITTYRTEHGYSDARRPDKVVWGKTLEEDLKRRDFTINAMALDCCGDESENCKLIDLFQGERDIKKKLVRTVGNPEERFGEDALRMMRAIRIAAQLGFRIEEKTFEAIKNNAALIDKIAKERVRDELFKILSSPNPYQGILNFQKSGLMKLILPELERGFSVDQKSPQRHHIYDVGTHSLMSLKECRSSDPVVRFATLIHDIGKPLTYKKLKNGVVTFYNHEVIGARIANKIASRLKFSKKQKEKLWKLVRWHQFSVDEHQTDSAVRRFIRNVGIENVEDMLELRRADRIGSGAKETSWRTEDFKKRLIEVQKQPFSVNDLKISGHDIMKELRIKPGPKVGKILNILLREVVEKKVENKKKALVERLHEII